MDDVLTLDLAAVFPVHKDRPILFSALAWAEVLLTLDEADFGGFMDNPFYGLLYSCLAHSCNESATPAGFYELAGLRPQYLRTFLTWDSFEGSCQSETIAKRREAKDSE
jgi:hypothetical protein